MSDSKNRSERERIRKQKREELKAQQTGELHEGSNSSPPGTPIEIESQAHFEEVTSTHMEPTIETLAAESDVAGAQDRASLEGLLDRAA